ncbi:hypothetical protein OKW29_000654 [Paraburkholderia sp. CI3]
MARCERPMRELQRLVWNRPRRLPDGCDRCAGRGTSRDRRHKAGNAPMFRCATRMAGSCCRPCRVAYQRCTGGTRPLRQRISPSYSDARKPDEFTRTRAGHRVRCGDDGYDRQQSTLPINGRGPRPPGREATSNLARRGTFCFAAALCCDLSRRDLLGSSASRPGCGFFGGLRVRNEGFALLDEKH